MSNLHWWNSGHPKTLQFAIFWCYFYGLWKIIIEIVFGQAFGFGALFLFIVGSLWLIAGVGLANDKRKAYFGAIVLAFLDGGRYLYLLFTGEYGLILNLIIAVALIASLLHPQSKQYQKAWFR